VAELVDLPASGGSAPQFTKHHCRPAHPPIRNLGKASAIVYTSSILSQGQELSVDKLWKTVDKQPPLGKTG
jgi:hypothetical protein